MAGAKGEDGAGFDDAWSELVNVAGKDRGGGGKPARPKRGETKAWTEDVRAEAKRVAATATEPGGDGDEESASQTRSKTLNWTDDVRGESLDERSKLDFNPISAVSPADRSAWASEVPDEAPVKSEMSTAEIELREANSWSGGRRTVSKATRPSGALKTSARVLGADGGSGASTSGVFDVFVPPAAPASSEDHEMDRVMSEVAMAEPVEDDDSIPPPSPSASATSLPLVPTTADAEEEMRKVMVEADPPPVDGAADPSDLDSDSDSADRSDSEGTERSVRAPETLPERPVTRSSEEPVGPSGRLWWAGAAVAAAVAFFVLNRGGDDDDGTAGVAKPEVAANAQVGTPSPSGGPTRPSGRTPRLSAGPPPPSAGLPPSSDEQPPPSDEQPSPSDEQDSPSDEQPSPSDEQDPSDEQPSPSDEQPSPTPAAEAPSDETAPPPTSPRGDPRTPPPDASPEAVAAFKKLPVSAADQPPVGGIGLTGIHVDDIALGASYERGRCRGGQERFSLGRQDRVNVCMRIVHSRDKEMVSVLWEKDGGTMRRSSVAIKPLHAYRTRAFLVLRSEYVGSWRVRIVSKDGVELASHSFEVVE